MASALGLLLLLSLALEDDARFQEAIEQYRAAEFEAAVVVLQDLALEGEVPPEDRGRLSIWIGLCHAQLGRRTSAERWLLRALELDADVVLPPETPPSLRDWFEQVRLKPQPPPPSVEAPLEQVSASEDGDVAARHLLSAGAFTSAALFGAVAALFGADYLLTSLHLNAVYDDAARFDRETAGASSRRWAVHIADTAEELRPLREGQRLDVVVSVSALALAGLAAGIGTAALLWPHDDVAAADAAIE